MSDKIISASDGDYTITDIISCKIQGFSICHLDGKCSVCPIALAHLNPKQPLHFWISEVKKW